MVDHHQQLTIAWESAAGSSVIWRYRVSPKFFLPLPQTKLAATI